MEGCHSVSQRGPLGVICREGLLGGTGIVQQRAARVPSRETDETGGFRHKIAARKDALHSRDSCLQRRVHAVMYIFYTTSH